MLVDDVGSSGVWLVAEGSGGVEGIELLGVFGVVDWEGRSLVPEGAMLAVGDEGEEPGSETRELEDVEAGEEVVGKLGELDSSPACVDEGGGGDGSDATEAGEVSLGVDCCCSGTLED